MHDRDPISETMQAAVAQGVFPGAVLLVRHAGRIRYHRAWGHISVGVDRQPVTVQTVYDLASLTKPLATATAIVCLVQDRRIRLDDTLAAILPELQGSAVERATVFHLLNHSAGLPAWRPFYERIAERNGRQPGFLGSDAARHWILDLIHDESPAYEIGTRSLYSDVGFMLLGMMVERLTGQSLAGFCAERVYNSVAACPLYFAAWGGEKAINSSSRQTAFLVAPTEDDPWRGRMLRGEVHDENAYALGGVAGHAGLFGTATAVAAITGLWLNGYLGKSGLLSPEWVRRCASRQDTPGSSWGLGWDTPSPPSSSGRYFSAQAFGHLGFTGTSIWIDPLCELEVVLLSNRVHPTRRNTAIQNLRPLLHDAVYEQVIDRTERKSAEAE